MKKTLFVPLVFVLSLIVCTFILACVFEFYFLTFETQVKLSFAQFWWLCLQLVPYCFFLAIMFTFSFILKNDLHLGLASLFLALMLVAGIFVFYYFVQNLKKENASFILQALKTVRTNTYNFSLQTIFKTCNIFFDDWFLVAQTSLKNYLLFSFSFWLAILSYAVITKKCTSWALLNFIFMLSLSLGSFFLYAYLQSQGFKAMAEETFLRDKMSHLTTIVFFSIAGLCFLFFAIKNLLQKLRAKKRSRF
ncbi:MAG: hypothetical protein P1P64_00690 [Treponemataceae bacterium]